MAFWSTIFPGQIPEHPIVPDALDGDVINLEGHELRIITVGQSDTAPSTIVYIPSLDGVISGDVAYNGIHQWLAQTDHEKRMQWIASVEQIEALKPKIVIAGHKRPDARDDDPATILGHTKSYIRDPICSGPSSRQSAAATSGSSALTTSTERSPAPATSQSARPGYALRYRSPPPTTATQTAKPPRPAPPAWWAPHPPARPPERRAPPEGGTGGRRGHAAAPGAQRAGDRFQPDDEHERV
jgi:hypothetical protein